MRDSQQAFRVYARPAAAKHGHPYLVFDQDGVLHLPLTVFAKEASARLASGSVKKYLAGILPWFTWLATDPWQVRAARGWDDPPAVVRSTVREYLVTQLGCQVRERPGGYETLKSTDAAIARVRFLLVGLKLFFRVAARGGYYHHANPLVDPEAPSVWAAPNRLAEHEERARMPAVSGVDAPPTGRRLTDSYFKLVGEQWVPQVVTDPHLCQRVLDGGRTLPVRQRHWGLREECVICLLFETGARVSEVLGLTLDDWAARDLGQTAWARNKGSRRRRAKFVRFSPTTAALLRRYVDTERAVADPQGHTLHDYLQLARRGELALETVPLFLSQRGTPWSVASFRTHFWKPACAAAGLDVDIHQARHWNVTQAVAEIHARGRRGEITVERGLAELVEYMQWRSGEAVLDAYNHFYDAANHAQTQDAIFKQLRTGAPAPVPPPTGQPAAAPIKVSESVDVTRAGMRALYEFLIGTGAAPDALVAAE